VVSAHGLTGCSGIFHDALSVTAHQLGEGFLAAGEMRVVSIFADG
jgi:hypothetical protein